MQGLSKKLAERITSVLTRHDVRRASVFGSFAVGKAGRKSDIDILVEFNGEKSLLDLAGLKMELEQMLNRNVDVLTYNSLHPGLRDRILAEQVAIL